MALPLGSGLLCAGRNHRAEQKLLAQSSWLWGFISLLSLQTPSIQTPKENKFITCHLKNSLLHPGVVSVRNDLSGNNTTARVCLFRATSCQHSRPVGKLNSTLISSFQITQVNWELCNLFLCLFTLEACRRGNPTEEVQNQTLFTLESTVNVNACIIRLV